MDDVTMLEVLGSQRFRDFYEGDFAKYIDDGEGRSTMLRRLRKMFGVGVKVESMSVGFFGGDADNLLRKWKGTRNERVEFTKALRRLERKLSAMALKGTFHCPHPGCAVKSSTSYELRAGRNRVSWSPILMHAVKDHNWQPPRKFVRFVMKQAGASVKGRVKGKPQATKRR